MDIRNYTWINSLENLQFNNNEFKSALSGTIKFIIALVGGIIGIVIIMVCGILVYGCNKKRK